MRPTANKIKVEPTTVLSFLTLTATNNKNIIATNAFKRWPSISFEFTDNMTKVIQISDKTN